MKLEYNQKVYLVTLIYAICAIPLYFILFKVPIPYIQPWMVFIYPLILPVCLIMRKKIRDKIIECNESLLGRVITDDLRKEYAEDTRAWMERTFESKRGKIISLILLVGCLMVPSLITFFLFAKIEVDLTIWEFIYLVGYGSTLIALLIYAGYNLFLFLQVSSIIHHFCFWKLKDEKNESNPLGELLILNILAFTCIYSIILNYLTPLLICTIVYAVSGVNPKINYLNNAKQEFLRHKKMTPFVILFANMLYVVKWVNGFFSYNDIPLFISGFLIFLILKRYLNDVLTAKYDDYEGAKTNFLETFAHEKIQVPYYLAITFTSLLPLIFSILTTSIWDWKFTLFIAFTIFSIISTYVGVSFLRYEKNVAIFQKFKTVFFLMILFNSCIPLVFYILDTIIFFSQIQYGLLGIDIFFAVSSLLFGVQFYRDRVDLRVKGLGLFFCISIMGISLIPLINSLLEFLFVQPIIPIFWQLWETLLLTTIGVIMMFLGIHFLRKETRRNVDRFMPYIPEHKIEETNFHFWATFNSNHAFYYSIFFGFTFFFLAFYWNVINIFEIPIYFNNQRLFTINLFGYFNLHQLFWIFGNYIAMYIFGVPFGFLIWLLFNATHDIWHSITLSEAPPDVHKDLYSSRKIFFQGAMIVLLICGGAAIWYVGDSLIKTSYFQVLFRFSNLLIMGFITFLGLIYIIRNEINRKKQKKEK